MKSFNSSAHQRHVLISALVITVFVFRCSEIALAEPEKNEAAAVEYERISADAAWCGPRILYFFSVYCGRERALSELVGLCHSDPSGFVSLDALVRAAKLVGLEPTAMRVRDGQEIIRAGGPAIAIIKNKQMHFIGIVCSRDDFCEIVDPSFPGGLQLVATKKLKTMLTGDVVFLRGATVPQSEPVMLLEGLTVALVMLLIALWYVSWPVRREAIGSGECQVPLR